MEQTINPSCRDEFFFNDHIEKGVTFFEQLACLRALLFVLKDSRINTLQSPGVEERRPVDELTQRGQRKVIEHTYASKSGRGYVLATPHNRSAPRTCDLNRDSWLLGRSVSFADRLVFSSMPGDERRLTLIAQEIDRKSVV